MNLVMNNLGPIGQARFDLNKRVSVFCGPNNTGKTYMSYVLYAFTRRNVVLVNPTMDDALVRDFTNNGAIMLPLDLDALYSVLTQRVEGITGDMSTIFGLSDTKARNMFPSTRVSIDVDRDSYAQAIKSREINFEIFFNGDVLARVSKQKDSDLLKIENKKKSWGDDERDIFRHDFLSQLYYRLANTPIYGSYFLPVERNSIYSFYKDIYSNRSQMLDFLKNIDENNRQSALNFAEKNSARYPLAISHTLETANRMSQMAEERGYYAGFADAIEQEILGGRLSVTEDGDMTYVSSRSPKKEIPLYLTASLTKAMSGLIFYLRHTCSPEDIIMIDEPEVNCHPDVQILMARVFARMANAGLRLVISTHSDYIVRELNNLIMLSGVSEDRSGKLKEWGYTPDMKLSPDDVGAYLFDYGKNNRVNMKPIEVTDSGFEVRTIDEAIAKLNEVSQTLYYKLRYGNKK